MEKKKSNKIKERKDLNTLDVMHTKGEHTYSDKSEKMGLRGPHKARGKS